MSFLPLFSTHSAAYAKIRTQNAYQHYPKKLTNGDPFRLYNYIVILFASQSIMLIISNIPCLTISCMPLIYSLKSLNYFRIGDDAYDVLYLGLRILRGIQPCCCTLSISGLICSSSEECIYLVVALTYIGDIIAYRDGLHFCCEEVYPNRNRCIKGLSSKV